MDCKCKMERNDKIINHAYTSFDAKSINESFARMVVMAFMTDMNPTLDELEDVKTAVSEAVTNCIVHAYPKDFGMITLRCRILKDNVLDIVIKDKGIGIENLDQARRPMFTTGGSDRSGMGFTIMESFMTAFDVSSSPGKGTTVHMRRKLQKRK